MSDDLESAEPVGIEQTDRLIEAEEALLVFRDHLQVGIFVPVA